MKKYIVLTLIITFCGLSINAQTKRIAHRSHNGASITYYEFEDDNLGLSPRMQRAMNRRYDSIQRLKFILKEDSALRKQYEDSIANAKKIKNTKKKEKVNQGKKEDKKEAPKQEKKKQKTKPLPPNDESRNNDAPKSKFLLLFLIAVPAGAIAFFTRKK